MSAEKLNDLKVDNTFSQIVYIDESVIINNEVDFMAPVFIDANLQIRGNLNTSLLAGLDTKDWLKKAIFINRGKVNGKSVFTSFTC